MWVWNARVYIPFTRHSILILPLQLGALGFMGVNLLAGGPASGARYIAGVLMALAVAGVLFVNATFNSETRPSA